MVDGLRLTISGDELCRLLSVREREHRTLEAAWRADLDADPGTGGQGIDERAQLPAHIIDESIERHAWRARVLAVIREHVEPSEIYRIGQADLVFAELLPPTPEIVAEQDYEETYRTRRSP